MTNTYAKYCPNVFVAKCDSPHEKGEIIEVETRHGKVNECVVHNLILQKGEYYYYSITRADGFNLQERSARKADKYRTAQQNALARAEQQYERSNEGREFLALSEPIKIGHHSEKRHRALIERTNRAFGKYVEEKDKAQEHSEKAEAWNGRTGDINLSMPESLEYYEKQLTQATERHEGLKSGKYPREHSFSLTYAKKEVNELTKKVELAKRLWG